VASSTKVDLSAGEQVQGLLPVANGGTGASTLAGAGLELTINKNAVSGYAGLNASGYVAPGQLGSGSANSASVLFGNNAWQALTRALVPENVTVSSASSLTLTTGSSCWVYTGSTATTWTLPAVSGNTGYFMKIENRGTGAITLTAAGADHIWKSASVTTMTIAANASLDLVNDGTYWNALSLDMTNNAIGILPIANGGTGQGSLTSLALTTPVITGFTETAYNGGTVTTAYTVNLANGTMHRILLTNATTCAITMPTAFAGMNFSLAVNQPSTTGSGLVTFSGVQWPGNVTPTMTQGANAVDVFHFQCFDGSTIRGAAVQGYPT
jgi:hypothetical protein